jgi:hypothetical protein
MQDMKEMMNTLMAQQMRQKDEAQVCQTGGQESRDCGTPISQPLVCWKQERIYNECHAGWQPN